MATALRTGGGVGFARTLASVPHTRRALLLLMATCLILAATAFYIRAVPPMESDTATFGEKLTLAKAPRGPVNYTSGREHGVRSIDGYVQAAANADPATRPSQQRSRKSPGSEIQKQQGVRAINVPATPPPYLHPGSEPRSAESANAGKLGQDTMPSASPPPVVVGETASAQPHSSSSGRGVGRSSNKDVNSTDKTGTAPMPASITDSRAPLLTTSARAPPLTTASRIPSTVANSRPSPSTAGSRAPPSKSGFRTPLSAERTPPSSVPVQRRFLLPVIRNLGLGNQHKDFAGAVVMARLLRRTLVLGPFPLSSFHEVCGDRCVSRRGMGKGGVQV